MRLWSYARRTLIGPICVLVLSVGPAVANSITETGPNDSAATANLTYGFGNLAISGGLSSAIDQDFFSFAVTKLGIPNPPFSTAIRIVFSNSPATYHFALIDPSNNIVVANDFVGPYTIDFNPNALGGIGTYTIQIAATSSSSVGSYQLSIFGVADGGGQPPVIVGSGSLHSVATAVEIPTLSQLNLVLISSVIAYIAFARLRRPNHSPNRTARQRRLRAVRSQSVSLVR